MLSSSMGYEFCPNGMGGVLGANSTGLFPSPCTSYSSSAGNAEMAQDLILPDYAQPTTAFGKRRRRRSLVSCRRRSTAVGGVRRRRRSTAVGGVRRRRSTAAGCSSMKVGGARRRRRSTRSSMYA